MTIALRYSTTPGNEPWYLREMAAKARAELGHTKEGQIHANRLDRIANMLAALLDHENHRQDTEGRTT